MFLGEEIHLSHICLETGANLSMVIIDTLPERLGEKQEVTLDVPGLALKSE